MNDAVWEHSVFSKHRDRLLTSDVAQQSLAAVNLQAKKFMSDEHFTVDGTLIQAWALQKSFRSKDKSGDYRKESRMSYLGDALVKNRNGLIAATMVTHADGFAERDAALLMLAERQQGRSRRITVGADKALRHQRIRTHPRSSSPRRKDRLLSVLHTWDQRLQHPTHPLRRRRRRPCS